MRFASTESLCVVALVFWGGIAAPAGAQRVDPGKVIDLHVNAERQNVSFHGSVMDGGRFRLTLNETGQMYGLSILHREGTTFSVAVERADGNRENPTFTTVETIVATLGRPAALSVLPYFTVVIDGTRRPGQTASRVPTVQPVLAAYTRRALVDDYCCVSCGGIVACACAVSSTCGQCCVNPCCKKTNPDGGPNAFLPSGDTRPLSSLGQRPCRQVPDSERFYPQFAPLRAKWLRGRRKRRYEREPPAEVLPPAASD